MSEQELLGLAGRVVDGARHGEQVEAYALHEVSTEVQVRAGELESLTSAESRGIGVRVVTDGRQGYAYTAVTSDEGLREVLEQARANAAVATPDEANGLPGPAEVPALDGLADPVLAGTPVEDRIAVALALDGATRGADPRILDATTTHYGDGHVQVALVSTQGLSLTQERTDAHAFTEAIARAGDETRTALGLTLGRGLGDLDVEAAGREAAQLATRLFGARKPRSRRCQIVLAPFVAAQFLGVLGAALSAEAVLKGRSLFAGRIGDDVAAPGVTLLDDGLRPGALGTAPWDAEGVPQQRTELIADGGLVSYLHDTWTARRTGGGAHSTGNASRAGFKSSPGVFPSNLYLESGGSSADQVVRSVQDGVYVQDVMGLHSGANPISGEFSVSFAGLAIRDGQLAEPIHEAAVSSTILDILRGIRAVATDQRFLPFGGSLGGSTTLIEQMSISGA
ncbi:MAG TPA: TldD/PmbA family protein [Nitriliruptorales bacterium]